MPSIATIVILGLTPFILITCLRHLVPSQHIARLMVLALDVDSAGVLDPTFSAPTSDTARQIEVLRYVWVGTAAVRYALPSMGYLPPHFS